MINGNDNNVKIFFKYGKEIIQLPVNPEEIRIVTGGSNSVQEVVSLGEINILKTPKLSELTIESFFPISEAPPYVLTSGEKFKTPDELISFFQKPYEKQEPIYMCITGLVGSSVGWTKDTRGSSSNGFWKSLGSNISKKIKSIMSLGTNTTYDDVPKMTLTTKSINKVVSIEHFETWHGTDFDTNFKLELKQYKNYGAKKFDNIISVDDEKGIATVTISSPTRPVTEASGLVKALKVASRTVRTVNRVAGIAKKTVNTVKSTGTFIKTVSKKI